MTNVKPCIKCGAQDRRPPIKGWKTGACHPCSLVAKRKWRGANKGHINEYNRKYYAANGEKYYKEYRVANRERQNEYNRKYYAANKEKIYVTKQKWRKINPVTLKGYNRKYAAANPDKIAEWQHARRARKMNNGGQLTATDIKFVQVAFPVCLCCGIDTRLELDHVIPIACGGRNDIANIQILCRLCNSSKGTKTIDYRPAYE